MHWNSEAIIADLRKTFAQDAHHFTPPQRRALTAMIDGFAAALSHESACLTSYVDDKRR